MTWRGFRYLVAADLYRVGGRAGLAALLGALCFGEEGFRYCFWMRVCDFTHRRWWMRWSVHLVARLMLRHYRYRYGIWLPFGTRVGPGLYIGHFGGIVVSPRAVIGANCNLSHGVTLGKANRGRREGYPEVGEGVYLGPGAVVSGRVRVGRGAAVGANCVVTQDVPDGAVVAGVPGRVVSMAGAAGYVRWTDYEPVLGPAPAEVVVGGVTGEGADG